MCIHAHIFLHTTPRGPETLYPNLVCGPQAERPLLYAAGSKGFPEKLHDQIYNLENFRKKTANEKNNGVAEPSRITKGIAGDHKGKVSRGTTARARERLP